MQVAQLSGVGFGYGSNELFREVSFVLNRGDRVALVAPNGAGKTTLLRVIAGELRPDEGNVSRPSEAAIAYYRQSHELAAEGSVRDSLLAGFGEVLELRDELAEAQRQAASGTEQALARLAALSDRYQLAGGDEVERQMAAVAQRLGFGEADLERPVASLSGGERGRLRLGMTLVKPADLLLLDEPTNHLDLDTIRWLEKHLGTLSSAVLCVSHDRAFLDAVCDQTAELGKRSFRVYPLPYSRYTVVRQQELEQEQARVDRQKALVAKTEEFIRRNIAAQKTKQAQSRRKMLAKLERLERPEDVWQVAERVRFRFAEAPRSGDIVLDGHGLSACRGGKELFSGLDLLVRRGDRIGIIGPNGCGKTSLLQLLSGSPAPEDRGEIRRGTNLYQGYYDQHLGTLEPERSAIDEIRSIRAQLNEDVTRQYLARFRFWGDDPFRTVRSLSGGECARLALAKLLLEPLNLLFLDEPTNHLDIPAAEILEEALSDFFGSVLVASHDRRFLETVTTRIVAFTADGVEIYEGNFADYVEQCARASAKPEPQRKGRRPRGRSRGRATASTAKAASEATGGGSGRRRVARAVRTSASTGSASTGGASSGGSASYAEQKRASRMLERKRRRLDQLEQEIAKHEAALAQMREQLKAPPGEDWLVLAKLAEREQALQKQVDHKMAEWLRLSEELSGHEAAGDVG